MALGAPLVHRVLGLARLFRRQVRFSSHGKGVTNTKYSVKSGSRPYPYFVLLSIDLDIAY